MERVAQATERVNPQRIRAGRLFLDRSRQTGQSFPKLLRDLISRLAVARLEDFVERVDNLQRQFHVALHRLSGPTARRSWL